MNKKAVFLSIFGGLLLAFSFSYSLVFALPHAASIKFDLRYVSDNFLLDAQDLRKNMLVVESATPVKDFSVSGECGAYGKVLGTEGNYSLLELGFTDTSCASKTVAVDLEIDDYSFTKNLHLVSDLSLYNLHLDRSDANIELLVEALDTELSEMRPVTTDTVERLQHERRMAELSYMKTFFVTLLKKRERVYSVPVPSASIPVAANKLPNAPRPYRADYTDGVHHGWDFDGELGEEVIAMDDGIVLRVVRDFQFEDLETIDKVNSDEQTQLQNLDILRGNQVWLKTMKGDVAFYSHLDEVFPEIEEGMMVSRGQKLGTIGITGVPDKSYTDYHLHIPIHKNPYTQAKNYSFDDYMRWPWYFQGESMDYILEHQGALFEK